MGVKISPFEQTGAVLQVLLVLLALLHVAVPVLLDGGEVLLDLSRAGFGEMKEELLALCAHLSKTPVSVHHSL